MSILWLAGRDQSEQHWTYRYLCFLTFNHFISTRTGAGRGRYLDRVKWLDLYGVDFHPVLVSCWHVCVKSRDVRGSRFTTLFNVYPKIKFHLLCKPPPPKKKKISKFACDLNILNLGAWISDHIEHSRLIGNLSFTFTPAVQPPPLAGSVTWPPHLSFLPKYFTHFGPLKRWPSETIVGFYKRIRWWCCRDNSKIGPIWRPVEMLQLAANFLT